MVTLFLLSFIQLSIYITSFFLPLMQWYLNTYLLLRTLPHHSTIILALGFHSLFIVRWSSSQFSTGCSNKVRYLIMYRDLRRNSLMSIPLRKPSDTRCNTKKALISKYMPQFLASVLCNQGIKMILNWPWIFSLYCSNKNIPVAYILRKWSAKLNDWMAHCTGPLPFPTTVIIY